MENLEKLIYDLYKKNARQCTNEEIYNALLIYTKNQLFEKGYQDGKKKIYYISAEFLIGKLLSNNLINLGIYDDVAAFLKENGKAIADIEEVEPEPSLGNGGLGRLAACFLDSIATLGLPGEGIIIWVFSNSSLRTDFRRKLRTHGLKNTAGSHLPVFPILYHSADFH